MKNLKKKGKDSSTFIEEIVFDTVEDFKCRRDARIKYERQWQLNMNFLSGNQYCGINQRGDIVADDKTYMWQRRETFNHIAPLIESRLSRLLRVSPVFSVRPKTDDDNDVKGASLSEKLLERVFEKCDIKKTVEKVTVWSETCGTGFYKVIWDNNAGNTVGKIDDAAVKEGDVNILPVSPFEIFPDNLFLEDVDDCFSIIHARAVPAREVREKYNVDITGDDIDVYSLVGDATTDKKPNKNVVGDAVVVIEKYEKPSSEFPNGRLITVAKDKLLYYGELPYLNGENKSRVFPFIKQECIKIAGNFFGQSIIERLIPIQRSLNAVKNRKLEFINRLSMGVMTVEDGSVDVEDLETEGLCPGKVLVYRQGSNAPEMMEGLSLPSDFSDEENKLLNEFVAVSGVSDVSASSSNAKASSGTALEILVEQDNEKLVRSAEILRRSYLSIAKHVVRLYAQFMAGVKAISVKEQSGKMKVLYADKSAVSSDEVYIENENELLFSNSQKKEIVMNLYKSGILADDNGDVRPAVKEKLLSLLGYKDLDYKKGVCRMHEEKAQNENEKIRKFGLDIEEIDDHGIHVDEHTRYALSEYDELNDEEKQRIFAHIAKHKEKLKNIKENTEK